MGRAKQWLAHKMEKYCLRLFCLQRVVRHARNPAYANEIINMNVPKIITKHLQDPHCVHIEHLGSRNCGKVIYLIEENDYCGGFFTIYHRLLLALSYADNFNFYPLAIWDRRHPCYDPQTMPGVENVFEYYFQPLGNISYPEALASENLVAFTSVHMFMRMQKTFERYNISPEEYRLCVEAQKKYIRIQPEIQMDLDKDINDLLSDCSVLGLHLRGTSFRWGAIGFPKSIDTEAYFKTAEEVMVKGKFDKIFLASDDETLLHKAAEFFGGKAIYFTDVCRSKGLMPVHYNNVDSNNNYRLGYEVLRDAVALSRCSGLVAGTSQVALAARIMAEADGRKYKYIRIYDHGVNKHSSNIAEAQRLRLGQKGYAL